MMMNHVVGILNPACPRADSAHPGVVTDRLADVQDSCALQRCALDDCPVQDQAAPVPTDMHIKETTSYLLAPLLTGVCEAPSYRSVSA